RRQVQLYAFLAGITQPFVGKALEVVAVLEFQLADAVAPGPQLSETRLVNGRLELVAVEVAGCAGLFIKRLQLLQPWCPRPSDLLQFTGGLLHGTGQQLLQVTFFRSTGAAHPRFDQPSQLIRLLPVLADPQQRLPLQRVTMLAPVIAY